MLSKPSYRQLDPCVETLRLGKGGCYTTCRSVAYIMHPLVEELPAPLLLCQIGLPAATPANTTISYSSWKTNLSIAGGRRRTLAPVHGDVSHVRCGVSCRSSRRRSSQDRSSSSRLQHCSCRQRQHECRCIAAGKRRKKG